MGKKDGASDLFSDLHILKKTDRIVSGCASAPPRVPWLGHRQ